MELSVALIRAANYVVNYRRLLNKKPAIITRSR